MCCLGTLKQAPSVGSALRFRQSSSGHAHELMREKADSMSPAITLGTVCCADADETSGAHTHHTAVRERD